MKDTAIIWKQFENHQSKGGGTPAVLITKRYKQNANNTLNTGCPKRYETFINLNKYSVKKIAMEVKTV